MFSIHGVSSLPTILQVNDNQKLPSLDLPPEMSSIPDTSQSFQQTTLITTEPQVNDQASIHDPECNQVSEFLIDTDMLTGGSSEKDQLFPTSTTLSPDSGRCQEDEVIESLPQSTKHTNIPKEGLSVFASQIDSHKSASEEQFETFTENLKHERLAPDIEFLDWQGLEDRYCNEMEPKILQEQGLMKEFELRFQQFMLWMQVSNEREAERATKRLRTRMAFVQNSEDRLVQKQNHYTQVVQAFQSAMNLFQEPQ